MAKATYKVWYKANDGTLCTFIFESDKSFKYYSHEYVGGINGLGNPIAEDMFAKAREVANRENSAMRRHGGFTAYGIKKIKCLDTGAERYFI